MEGNRIEKDRSKEKFPRSLERFILFNKIKWLRYFRVSYIAVYEYVRSYHNQIISSHEKEGDSDESRRSDQDASDLVLSLLSAF